MKKLLILIVVLIIGVCLAWFGGDGNYWKAGKVLSPDRHGEQQGTPTE